MINLDCSMFFILDFVAYKHNEWIFLNVSCWMCLFYCPGRRKICFVVTHNLCILGANLWWCQDISDFQIGISYWGQSHTTVPSEMVSQSRMCNMSSLREPLRRSFSSWRYKRFYQQHKSGLSNNVWKINLNFWIYWRFSRLKATQRDVDNLQWWVSVQEMIASWYQLDFTRSLTIFIDLINVS